MRVVRCTADLATYNDTGQDTSGRGDPSGKVEGGGMIGLLGVVSADKVAGWKKGGIQHEDDSQRRRHKRRIKSN